jgi:type II secretory pathway pseudopilin PulG
MTLVEVAVALAVLTVAAGALLQVLAAVNSGQQRLWASQKAFELARNAAEDLIQCETDWMALAGEYDAWDDVDVAIESAGGSPDAAWSKVTVRATVPVGAGDEVESATLVFGRQD